MFGKGYQRLNADDEQPDNPTNGPVKTLHRSRSIYRSLSLVLFVTNVILASLYISASTRSCSRSRLVYRKSHNLPESNDMLMGLQYRLMATSLTRSDDYGETSRTMCTQDRQEKSTTMHGSASSNVSSQAPFISQPHISDKVSNNDQSVRR